MSRRTNGPKNLRELSLYSAGMYAGLRNLHMAQAATKGRTKAERAASVRSARECHHTYLARLREADGQPGYYVPESMRAPVDRGLMLLKRQAA